MNLESLFIRRKFCHEEKNQNYGAETGILPGTGGRFSGSSQVGKCGKFQDGEVFFVEEGQYDTFTHGCCFCQSAWDTIKDTFYSGLMGGNLYREGWSRDPGKLVLCCRDGIRSVLFLVEKMDENEEG